MCSPKATSLTWGYKWLKYSSVDLVCAGIDKLLAFLKARPTSTAYFTVSNAANILAACPCLRLSVRLASRPCVALLRCRRSGKTQLTGLAVLAPGPTVDLSGRVQSGTAGTTCVSSTQMRVPVCRFGVKWLKYSSVALVCASIGKLLAFLKARPTSTACSPKATSPI